MLSDRWDMAHICIAVDHLEAGMARYTEAFGIEWGPILDYSAEGLVLSATHTLPMATCAPGHGEGISMDGLREVWSVTGGTQTASGLPVAPIELAHARDFSPAYTIWGCPHGREFVHHIAYWVDDIEAESTRLIEQGWTVDLGDAAPPAS